jgi:glycosyltransferase involved in cell wall biosynthesis
LNNLKLSIIIPAYNEENRISATLDALVHFLSTHSNLNLKNTEIIIANDGSSDNTLEKLQNIAPMKNIIHKNATIEYDKLVNSY